MAVYQFAYSFENDFRQTMFTSTEFRSKFAKTYYLEFVKLKVARILGKIYSCVHLVPVPRYLGINTAVRIQCTAVY